MYTTGDKKHLVDTPPAAAAALNTWIIDKAFYMPQLHRSRRIWLYLPPDYYTSKDSYPVIYMQDGQNLFEEWSAFGEEWGVDETLNAMNGKCIVVGIDNAGTRRMNEYALHDHERYGKGEGAQYLSFLVETLKPYIDQTYRTLPTREHTYIAGSSLGALISYYACLYYPEVFGGAGIFSPAFWIAPDLAQDAGSKANGHYKQRFYFYYGEEEGAEMVDHVQPIVKLLEAHPQYDVTTVVKNEGTHSESEWRQQFPWFYKWMMNKGKKKQPVQTGLTTNSKTSL
ncbi:alpha/beta hydrolase [Segetibacter sp. 3557_3]|uniref:alpha/beta hydrolase n=1 Tax=Segetibacter sp. 3557_3 TaxID=2547429 RepID=UPI001058EA59|nr:alpha/beta hydrolase-fold protein [Segetibacter sp. 3557_3]TDH21561.1 alpha/beta hydrolase [Segetibacter sp. 3557_3]